MEKVLLNKFYLDKEKDIIISIYRNNPDEVTYVLETPNHNTGNLITNLAKLCGQETVKDENDMKILTGVIPASINGDNKTVYILRLGGIKIANIYEERKCRNKGKNPSNSKNINVANKRI